MQARPRALCISIGNVVRAADSPDSVDSTRINGSCIAAPSPADSVRFTDIAESAAVPVALFPFNAADSTNSADSSSSVIAAVPADTTSGSAGISDCTEIAKHYSRIFYAYEKRAILEIFTETSLKFADFIDAEYSKPRSRTVTLGKP
ncbi:hypothetical protein K445DRAFT_310426 [Daldinia sp. EC12]|nr:hypothetical protein K445DRAFT_310426 [Daldinia sp. EC12]